MQGARRTGAPAAPPLTPFSLPASELAECCVKSRCRRAGLPLSLLLQMVLIMALLEPFIIPKMMWFESHIDVRSHEPLGSSFPPPCLPAARAERARLPDKTCASTRRAPHSSCRCRRHCTTGGSLVPAALYPCLASLLSRVLSPGFSACLAMHGSALWELRPCALLCGSAAIVPFHRPLLF